MAQENCSGFNVSKWYFLKYQMCQKGRFSQSRSQMYLSYHWRIGVKSQFYCICIKNCPQMYKPQYPLYQNIERTSKNRPIIISHDNCFSWLLFIVVPTQYWLLSNKIITTINKQNWYCPFLVAAANVERFAGLNFHSFQEYYESFSVNISTSL